MSDQGIAPHRGRGRPRDPEADKRILEAAAALILSRGFEQTTVDEVASRAHVGKATVYRRWATKDELGLAAMQHLYDVTLPHIDTGDLRKDMLETYDAGLRFANSTSGQDYIRTSISESMRDPKIAVLYRNALLASRQDAKRMFDRAIERGELDADIDLDLALESLAGLLVQRVISGDPLPSPDKAEAYVDFILNGLGWSGETV